MCGAVVEPAEDTRAVLCVIGLGARVDVHHVVFECAIDQDGELARSGGNRLRLSGPERQAPIERASRGLGPPEILRPEAEDRGGAVRRRLRTATEQAAAGDLVLGREG